jgi:hypothetical protein
MKNRLSLPALHYGLALLLGGPFAFCSDAYAQKAVPELHTTSPRVSILDGYRNKRNTWTLSADADPDVYETQLPAGASKKVRFYSDQGEVVFNVESGKTYSFNIIFNGKVFHTQIVGKPGPDTYDIKF